MIVAAGLAFSAAGGAVATLARREGRQQHLAAILDREALGREQIAHGPVVRRQLREQVRNALAAGHFDSGPHQRRADASPLPRVRHDKRQHPVVRGRHARDASDARDLRLAGRTGPLGDERELAVVVDVADPGQPLVRGPFASQRSVP